MLFCFDQGTGDVLPEKSREERGMMHWEKTGVKWRSYGIGLNHLKKMAKQIGKIELDYGDNSCKATDCVLHLTSEKIQKKLK